MNLFLGQRSLLVSTYREHTLFGIAVGTIFAAGALVRVAVFNM
jgi:hypothetical protein